jgi:hypothetical protein
MPQLDILIVDSKIDFRTILAKSFGYPSNNQNTNKAKVFFNSFAFVQQHPVVKNFKFINN